MQLISNHHVHDAFPTPITQPQLYIYLLNMRETIRLFLFLIEIIELIGI